MKHIVSTHANRYIGNALIITSAISFGVMPIFARLAYESGADPITVLLLRFGIAAVVMMGIMLFSKTPFPRGLVLLELILLGAIGYVGESLAYFTALTMASPGLVALLLYIYPALVTALSAIFLKEHLTTIKVVALFLALSGTAGAASPASCWASRQPWTMPSTFCWAAASCGGRGQSALPR